MVVERDVAPSVQSTWPRRVAAGMARAVRRLAPAVAAACWACMLATAFAAAADLPEVARWLGRDESAGIAFRTVAAWEALALGSLAVALAVAAVPGWRGRGTVAATGIAALGVPFIAAFALGHPDGVVIHGFSDDRAILDTLTNVADAGAYVAMPAGLIRLAALWVSRKRTATGGRAWQAGATLAGFVGVVALSAMAAVIGSAPAAPLPSRVAAYVTGAAPSLACAGASSRADVAACSDPSLMRDVDRYASAYRAALAATRDADHPTLEARLKVVETLGSCGDAACVAKAVSYGVTKLAACYAPSEPFDAAWPRMACAVWQAGRCPHKTYFATPDLLRRPAVVAARMAPFLARPTQRPCDFWSGDFWSGDLDPEGGGADFVVDEGVAMRPGFAFLSENTVGVANRAGGPHRPDPFFGMDPSMDLVRPNYILHAHDAVTGREIGVAEAVPGFAPGSEVQVAMLSAPGVCETQFIGVRLAGPLLGSDIPRTRMPDSWYPTDSGDLRLVWSYFGKWMDDGTWGTKGELHEDHNPGTVVGVTVPREVALRYMAPAYAKVLVPADVPLGWEAHHRLRERLRPDGDATATGDGQPTSER